MSQTKENSEKDRKQHAFNLTLAAVAGQVGCLTTLFIVIALFIGLWLDNYLDTSPIFTIVLLIGSVPFTVVAMLWVVRKATSKIVHQKETRTIRDIEEENERGR